MKTVLLTIAAVIVGLIVLFVHVVAVELFSNVVHPFPKDFGGTIEEVCQHVTRYPPWVLAVVVPAWAVAAFVSSWTARKIGNSVASTIVGLILLAALAYNLSMLPYPTWFRVANLIVIPTALVASNRLWIKARSKKHEGT